MKPTPRRTLTKLAMGLLLLVLILGTFLLLGAGPLINWLGKGRIERAFATACPGYTLQLGDLEYSLARNRLILQAAKIQGPNATLKAGKLELLGVHWRQLIWEKGSWPQALAKASLDFQRLELELPKSYYSLRCARLRASVPHSELIAEAAELRPMVQDEVFFAAQPFRSTRFEIVLPECRVEGLKFEDLLQGKSFHTASIRVARPTFDALVNRDKPPQPFVKSPLMVHEALASLSRPLRIDRLSIMKGHLTYRERVIAGTEPGILTFSRVNISIDGIANRGVYPAAIQMRSSANFMNAAVLQVQMTVPIEPPSLSLHYAGSLTPMDLTRLGSFLEPAEHVRIKSGSAQEVTFAIDVTEGHARGQVHAIYQDLEIAILDKLNGTEQGLENRVASFLANALKIRDANAPDASGSLKTGVVDYTRKPGNQFLQFVWFGLRSGVLDVISH